ncbi:MAG: hypothetical protein IPJ29_02840 [Chitinophagaceae bacterium]|nr:hypothetical protein [Chitinophagaceae bacterium]
MRYFKIVVVLSMLLLAAFVGYSQTPSEISTLRPSFFKTKPLSQIIKEGPSFTARIVRDENGMLDVNKKTAVIHPFDVAGPGIPDPLLQTNNGRTEAASAIVGANFDGMGFTSVNPADPVSATGPNHVIQMINAASGAVVRIFDKTGSTVVNSFLLSDITNVQGAGDPIVLYDPIAGRWLLNEFGFSGGVTSYINTLIFAISVTDDPAGAWYVYSFADNSFFVDYQKIAIWHNAYYATSNDFNTAGTAYLGSSIYAFDRTKMLAGDPTATGIRSRQTHPTNRYFSMAPVTQEGTSSSSLSGQFCFYQNDAWTADALDVDSIYTFGFTPDFVTPANSVITAPTQMATAALDDDLCAAAREACINQQGGVSVEALTGRLMNKIIYRKFPGYESIVVNATVDANGAGRAGIRWWELRRSGGAWSIFQEGTYSPDGSHRWMGAICQDAQGNIGLVYNVSSTTGFPSLRITARNPCDPLGTMTLPEQTIIAGTIANTSTRYGDYNSLSIDPADNLTFWLTGMYNAATSWSTRLSSFTLNNCAPLTKVRFQTSSLALREQDANVTAGCLNYKDYVVNVLIDAAPSADAILTFTKSGTATDGRDYTVTPASVTLNGANLTRTVTVRVYNDAAFEGTETLNLGYTLNNSGGNAVADDYNQACSVNIVDDDNEPAVSEINYAAVGFGNVGAITSGPFNGSAYTDKRLQNLYLASELTSIGIPPGSITNFQWRFATAIPTLFNNLNVRIGFVPNTTTTLTGFVAPTFTTIYTGNFTTPAATGWYNFTLPTPVTWNGTDNIIIETCFDNTVTTADITLIGTTVSGYTPTQFIRQNAAGSVCASATGGSNTTRPNIRLTMTTPINTVANTIVSKVASLGPNDDVPFYDATGRILARVKNLTAWDYGCTTVEVDRAGTGSTAFWNNNAANHLTNKTFRITPTNANASGQYEITLYYTAAEKTGYESATGQSWSGIQMIKTVGPINGITPATPLPSTVTINSVLTPGTFGSDFTLKGTFTNGFSGFAVGKPGNVLPVSLLSFNGRKNNTVVDLDWKTSFEQDNSRFEVETSKDATNFYRIGTVTSKGNSSSEQQYAFTDNLPINGINYYRLKQIDLDARNSYSRTISVVFDKKGKDITIYPNPAKDKLTVGFVKPADNVIL